MSAFRVLVCGGRDYADRRSVEAELDTILAERGAFVVIQGGADGADRLARQYAFNTALEFFTFEADWKTHGKAAGPIRNQQMLAEGKPDLVLAFPGGAGTADMVRRARKAGVPVRILATRRDGDSDG